MTPTLKGRGYRWWTKDGATLVRRTRLQVMAKVEATGDGKGRSYRWWAKVEAHDEDPLLQRRVLTRPCDLKKSHLHFRFKLNVATGF
jgi:hypothetical protein